MPRYTFRPQYRKTDDFEYIHFLNSQHGKDNSTEHAKLIRCLREAVRTELTPRQKQILMMYFVHNMKQIEIAEALGVTKSTVSRSILRSKKKLQKCLRYFDIEHLAA